MFLHCFILEKEEVFHKFIYVLFMFLYAEFIMGLSNESVNVLMISLLSLPG